MKVSELEGALLDYWVAKAEGYAAGLRKGVLRISRRGHFDLAELGYMPSTDWPQGGPIIERENIELSPAGDGTWDARCWGDFLNTEKARWIIGPTPLIAAMRAYVASKFGDEVPEEP